MRTKRMTTGQGKRCDISRFPNFHKTGSIKGMKRLYYGKFCFSKYTPYGQDFSFSVDTFDNDADVLLENIYEYYQGYDPDYEAYLWIGDDGHGRNGAPYHIIDIVNDMKAAENMVYELHTALNNAFNA